MHVFVPLRQLSMGKGGGYCNWTITFCHLKIYFTPLSRSAEVIKGKNDISGDIKARHYCVDNIDLTYRSWGQTGRNMFTKYQGKTLIIIPKLRGVYNIKTHLKFGKN